VKFLVKRERKRRFSFNQIESDYLSLKFIVSNQKIPLSVRWEASLRLSKLMRNKSSVLARNRCNITGRGRGVLRYTMLSRILTRDLALTGKLPYITKASW